MKRGFYLRLAGEGIVKNKKLYFPYIVTCICMTMIFYIICYLGISADLSGVEGGEMVQSILKVGIFIIALFSLIFLYYTNSFLIRRRKKEFGLYNILGMGKGSLLKILFWENIISAAVAMAAGIGAGILFSKLAELAAIKLLGGKPELGIKIESEPVLLTIVWFAAIFTVILLRMLVSLLRLRPVELLRSENIGEKPPRSNWFIALAGAALLVSAYYLAVAVMDPMSAMSLFFLVVAMVIAATYFLFIAGSVVLCRLLQKNKKYYYKTNHFISVSSMAYRMKRNGAGLASICILSTMMLVTVSSTVCLYAQLETFIDRRYSKDISIESKGTAEGEMDAYMKAAEETVAQSGYTEKNMEYMRLLSMQAAQDGEFLQPDLECADSESNHTYEAVRRLYIISLDDYNAISGRSVSLKKDELLLYAERMEYPYDIVTIGNLGTWKAEVSDSVLFDVGSGTANMEGSIYMVVSDASVLEEICAYQNESAGSGGNVSIIRECCGFDLPGCDNEEQMKLCDKIMAAVDRQWSELQAQGKNPSGYLVESRAYGVYEASALYGGLLFLGLLLGAVFLFGTVLIMYYKQISEGYEDQARFEILMKVGMTEKEVKKSINSQVLTVFFLPLLTAGVHLAFAYPLISKILLLMSAAEGKLLAKTTICCYLVFVVFYVAVYKITSKSYYTIVSKR